VSTLGDYDFWPGQFVLEKLAVEDSARCQRTGIVRDVDALERTVNVLWISPAGSDTVSYGRSGPTVETVSAYELVEHPDFSFCTGEVVIRSAVNIEKSEADLTNGSLASRELVTHSDFLSCIGNVLGYKDDGIEVQWANGVISKVNLALTLPLAS
jgi:ubiquitin-conjugating enzyme E2 O